MKKVTPNCTWRDTINSFAITCDLVVYDYQDNIFNFNLKFSDGGDREEFKNLLKIENCFLAGNGINSNNKLPGSFQMKFNKKNFIIDFTHYKWDFLSLDSYKFTGNFVRRYDVPLFNCIETILYFCFNYKKRETFLGFMNKNFINWIKSIPKSSLKFCVICYHWNKKKINDELEKDISNFREMTSIPFYRIGKITPKSVQECIKDIILNNVNLFTTFNKKKYEKYRKKDEVQKQRLNCKLS